MAAYHNLGLSPIHYYRIIVGLAKSFIHNAQAIYSKCEYRRDLQYMNDTLSFIEQRLEVPNYTPPLTADDLRQIVLKYADDESDALMWLPAHTIERLYHDLIFDVPSEDERLNIARKTLYIITETMSSDMCYSGDWHVFEANKTNETD